MNIEDITIIIPVRNELDLFELNLKSIRKYYPDIKILSTIDDLGIDEQRLQDYMKLSDKYRFNFEDSIERKGLVYHVPSMIKTCDTPVICYLHADMVISENFLENMYKHLDKKTIVSGTRIEPPLHPEQPDVKITKNFGINGDDFKEDKFNKTVKILQSQYTDKYTGGVFAPHMFYKEDWMDYSPEFAPQSKEDSFLWRKMLLNGYTFKQSWDAYVYHFTCRGSRYAKGVGVDSDEWEKSNRKNTKNYIRLYNSEPLYSNKQEPQLVPNINVDAFIIPDNLCNIEVTLDSLEPYFQTLYIYGKENQDKIKEEINKYCEKILDEGITNFDRRKIQLIDTETTVEDTINQIREQMKSDFLCVTGNSPLNSRLLNGFRNNLDSTNLSVGYYHNKKTPSAFIFHKSIEWKDNKPVDIHSLVDIKHPKRLEFINKYGETPEYRQTFLIPHKTKKKQSLGLVIIQKNEEHLVENLIWRYEPYFDEICIITDGTNHNKMEEFVSKYCEQTQGMVLYDLISKFKLDHREMNGDFAKQRNHADSLLSTDYILHLDADELFDSTDKLNDIDMIHNMIETIKEEEVDCILFPRKNYIDGEQTSAYPDLQGRLYKRGHRWINKYPFVGASNGCHEQIDCMQDSSMIVDNVPIIHLKTSKKQDRQNSSYKVAWRLKSFPDNILYDSVLYTNEGITYHAKKEIEVLLNNEYNVKTLEHYQSGNEYSDVLEKANAQFPVNENNYITIVNQPPERWGSSLKYKNVVPYLAFEGKPPEEWVEAINSNHINRLMVPSTYVKECFIEAGVTTPISVVPHGVDMKIWKPNKVDIKNKPFTILGAGAPNSERKGLDILIRTFCKAYKPTDNVQLVLKVNKIYNPKMNVNDYIAKYATEEMLDKIVYIDYDMKEKEMVELFNFADLFVSSSRSEGFNLMPLQAMACKTPVMVTTGGGHMDYTNDTNSILIPILDKPYLPKYKHPYKNSEWFNIDEEVMVIQLQTILEEKDSLNDIVVEGYKTAKNYSWENTISTMIEKLTKREV